MRDPCRSDSRRPQSATEPFVSRLPGNPKCDPQSRSLTTFPLVVPPPLPRQEQTLPTGWADFKSQMIDGVLQIIPLGFCTARLFGGNGPPKGRSLGTSAANADASTMLKRPSNPAAASRDGLHICGGLPVALVAKHSRSRCKLRSNEDSLDQQAPLWSDACGTRVIGAALHSGQTTEHYSLGDFPTACRQRPMRYPLR